MIVLDLGCGEGLTPQKLNLPPSWQIIGLDADYTAISKAQTNFPHRAFIRAAGERLPFPASTFNRVVSNVALPYMNVAKVLAEVHRILVPGGTILASLHSVSFTLAQLRSALPRPKALVYWLPVLANGLILHVAGRNFGEAFQTERGIRIALQRAGFADASFFHDSKRWFVEATKPLQTQPL